MASSFGRGWKYDVFLSFRGEDTRKIFVGHLYKALTQKAINTFIDSEELSKGNDLSQLLKAINESRFSIIVFSENYASSTWCLKELVTILDCMKTNKQIVVPIFYQVDPSDVRKLKSCFAEAFAEHDRDPNIHSEEIQRWRSALTEAANLSGWDSRHYRDDAKLIDKVVQDIFNRLINISSSKVNGLVGMASHIEKMESLLCPRVDEWVACPRVDDGDDWADDRDDDGADDRDDGAGADDWADNGVDDWAGLDDWDDGAGLDDWADNGVDDGAGLDDDWADNGVDDGAGLDDWDDGGVDDGAGLDDWADNGVDDGAGLDDWDDGGVDDGAGLDDWADNGVDDGAGLDDWADDGVVDGFFVRKEVGGVRIVGIWGMGGVGKTTIARAVYDKISCEFEHHCFLQNVREGFMKKGDVLMQEELLSGVLNENVQSLGILSRGYNMIMERLSQKKVLLVLDDVDNFAQIETLLGRMKPSFGDRSRIIITTRDLQSLSGVDVTYSPTLLPYDEALQLFSQYAFRTNQPTSEYNHLSRKLIEYAQGLPLALKVLGSFLDNKSAREWGYVLEKIKKIPHRGIQDVLRISFDGLDDLEKDIFLDIACFFKGKEKDYVAKLLDGCGFFFHCGLRVLVDRALVTVSPQNMLETHDLLQEMGREIVRQESIKDPGRRSRLWCHEDAKLALTQNTTTEAVEGIVLDLSYSKDMSINTDAVARMKRLRLLRMHYDEGNCKQHVNGDLQFLSHELSCLIWMGYPMKSLPSNFHPKNLVDLDMRDSRIEELWEVTEPLEKLEFINLSHSQCLKKLPDLTEAINLQTLSLEGCTSLSEVQPSISAHKKLSLLLLKDCKELKSFPTSIDMKSLKILNLSGCSKIEVFPEISGLMEELSELHLDKTAIRELPSSIERLKKLVLLDMRDCKSLVCLPENVCDLTYLERLLLSGCSQLRKIFRTSIDMKSLKILDLSGCSKIEVFPEISGLMEELSELHLDKTAIKELPSSIERLKKLVLLDMRDCKSLVCLPDNICNLTYLERLLLARCSQLRNLPENMGNLELLMDLQLEGSGVEQLPSSILRLGRLKHLCCHGSVGMAAPFSSWPSAEFKQLDIICWTNPAYSTYSALEDLDLSDCNVLELSDGIAHLSSLRILKLCRNNFESLPATMNKLVYLTTLHVEACKRLKSIPQLSSRISNIDAHDCTALETVATPEPHYGMNRCFTFSNCVQLQTSLFRDTVETTLDRDNYLGGLSFKMSLPGCEIPDWFNHQQWGCSVTAKLRRSLSHDMFLGFAICAVSNYVFDPSAKCLCTLKGSHGEDSFSFGLLDNGDVRSETLIELDHMFLRYVPCSQLPVMKKWSGRQRHYTEARFEFVVENGVRTGECKKMVTKHQSITSCGVRFFASKEVHVNLPNRKFNPLVGPIC